MNRNPRIFITGGASGLGRALAQRYALEGWRVCIADINDARGAETVERLTELGAVAHYLHCDVRDESQFMKAAAWLKREWKGVDVVVNNAGVASAGTIDAVPLSDWEWIIDINLLGVVRGCKTFTPLLREQGHGRLVNIASMAGLIHPPCASAYNATKAAVVALSETLMAELWREGIAVSVVCPAFFRTNLMESMRATSAHLRAVSAKMINKADLDAAQIADGVFEGIARGDTHILTHTQTRIIWRLKRLLPFQLYLKLIDQGSGQLFDPARDSRSSPLHTRAVAGRPGRRRLIDRPLRRRGEAADRA